MAKQSCCHKKKLRRGLWSPEEDEKLMSHIANYGLGSWSSVPKLAGSNLSYVAENAPSFCMHM
jgi:transcription factor MYB, plant